MIEDPMEIYFIKFQAIRIEYSKISKKLQKSQKSEEI